MLRGCINPQAVCTVLGYLGILMIGLSVWCQLQESGRGQRRGERHVRTAGPLTGTIVQAVRAPDSPLFVLSRPVRRWRPASDYVHHRSLRNLRLP